LNRLILHPEWATRVLTCIAGKESDAAIFADELGRRCALGFGLVRVGDEEEFQRSFLLRIHTPAIFIIGEGLRLLATLTVSPGKFQDASSVIDSLLAGPPGLE
jgi:hypothetical protein